MFSFSAANYSLKLHKKYSIKAAAHGTDDLTRHYIIRYLSARELVLPPCGIRVPGYQRRSDTVELY